MVSIYTQLGHWKIKLVHVLNVLLSLQNFIPSKKNVIYIGCLQMGGWGWGGMMVYSIYKDAVKLG